MENACQSRTSYFDLPLLGKSSGVVEIGSRDFLQGVPMKAQERAELLSRLCERFEQNPLRHPTIAWASVEERLSRSPKLLKSLLAMEATGGEPDVVDGFESGEQCVFVDCSAESPSGRRSLCYDRAALDSRKENKPRGCVLDMARELGVAL